MSRWGQWRTVCCHDNQALCMQEMQDRAMLRGVHSRCMCAGALRVNVTGAPHQPPVTGLIHGLARRVGRYATTSVATISICASTKQARFTLPTFKKDA